MADVSLHGRADAAELADDIVVPFSLEGADVRGRIVRLGPMVSSILARHEDPASVAALLGEAVALTALLGASLKFDGRFVIEAKSDGPVDFLAADFSTPGNVRGYAHFDEAALARFEAGDGGASLLGNGHLAMTVDQGADMDLYQGIVPLEGGRLADAALEYFAKSEQIPTALHLGAGQITKPGDSRSGPNAWRAGGIMIQHLPPSGPADFEMDDEGWRNATALFKTVEYDEILDPALSPERLLYRLFHEGGVRVHEPVPVQDKCRCSKDRFAATLSRFGADEIADMAQDGVIGVTCEFCNRNYAFTPDEITSKIS